MKHYYYQILPLTTIMPKILLSSEANNEQMRDLLVGLGYDPTNEMTLALVVLQRALNGDIKTFSKIQDVIDRD